MSSKLGSDHIMEEYGVKMMNNIDIVDMDMDILEDEGMMREDLT